MCVCVCALLVHFCCLPAAAAGKAHMAAPTCRPLLLSGVSVGEARGVPPAAPPIVTHCTVSRPVGRNPKHGPGGSRDGRAKARRWAAAHACCWNLH